MADRQIPVFATAISSFHFVLTHRRELVRLGLFAVPAFLLVTLSLESFMPIGLSGRDLSANAARSLIDLLARSAIAAVILVAWHRVVMLETSDRNALPSLGFGVRELRYLMVWLMLSLGFLGVFIAVVALMVVAQFAAMLALYLLLLLLGLAKTLVIGQRDQFEVLLWIAVVFAIPAASYVAGRLTLVLPALALDRRRPLRQAWRMSAGNGWRLVAASLLVLVPMESAATLCSVATMNARNSLAYYPLATVAAFALFLLIVLTGTILSLFSLQLDGAGRQADPYRANIAVAE